MYRYFKNYVDADTLNVSTEHTFNAKRFIGLLASEFLNSLKLKSLEWNKTAPEKSKVKLKDNSMYPKNYKLVYKSKSHLSKHFIII